MALIVCTLQGATGGGAQYQGLKFASGIPFNMLEPVDDPNTPGAVITSRGVIAVPKMDRCVCVLHTARILYATTT